ncbi:MAG TPA: hypothetical protein VLC09_14865 [Polyangiaceae bacterium]|nr:hypothetical protein [Polyangiaceae bacterium]
MKQSEISSYRLVRSYGSSNSSFLAEPRDGGPLSILKVFPGELLDAEGWSEVCSHFRAWTPKPGPVCRMNEIGLVEGRVYAVAPYIHGDTLAQIIKATNMNREATRSLAHHRAVALVIAQLVEGVLARGSDDFSHPVFDHDMVTPSELFVQRDGEAMVLDARWAWLRARTTGSPWSSLERNLAYLAPTRRDEARAPDAGRSWALGVMWWELSTGYRLFRRNTLESTLHAVAGGEVPDPRLVNSTVPEALASLMLSVLSRPGAVSLSGLRDGLRRWLGKSHPEDQTAVALWLERLFPDDAPVLTMSKEPLVPAGDAEEWSAVEESTTCIAVAPSGHESERVQLSWLEGDALPRMTRQVDPPAPAHPHPSRAQKLAAGAVLFGLLGLGWLEGPVGPAPSSFEPSPRLATLAGPMPLGEQASPRRIERQPFEGVLLLEEIPLRRDDDSGLEPPPERPASGSGTPGARAADRPAPSGDLLVRTAAGSVVSYRGTVVGEGTFRLRLPVGQHVLRVQRADGVVTYTQVEVRAGALGFAEIN